MIQVDWYPDHKKLRQFGVAALIWFLVVGGAVFKWTASVPAAGIVWAVGITCFAAGRLHPGTLRPFYLFCLLVTWPIGRIVSEAVLLMLYYCVLTPIGLIMRARGRDPLSLKRPTNVETHWKPRATRCAPESYFRQS